MKKTVIGSAVMALVATLLAGMMLTSAVVAPVAQADTIEHAMGLAFSPVATPAVPAPVPAPLASSVDLRQWAVPAGYQGSVSACTAWTVGYDLMGWYANKNGVGAQAFAPMSIFSQAMYNNILGNTLDNAFQLAVSKGVDTQDDYMPQGSFDFQTLPTAAQLANASKYRLTGYNTLFSTGIYTGGGASGQNLIQSALSTGIPVAIGINARQGLVNWGTHTNVNDLFTDLTSPLQGGHAVLAVGYDANGLLIQNSWSSTWGTDGFARLSWAVVQQDVHEAYVATGLNPVTASSVVKIASRSGMPQSVWTPAPTGSSEAIQIPSNTAWTLTSAPSWLTVGLTGGFGLVLPGMAGVVGVVNLQATANMTGSFRTGTVTFSAKSGGPGASLTVNQYSATGPSVTPSLTLSQSSWDAPVTPGSLTVSVSSNTSWAVSSSDSWVTMSADTGFGNGSVSLIVQATYASVPRSATVTFSSTWGSPTATATVKVSQRALVPASLLLSRNSWPASPSGDSTQVTVTSNVSWQVTGDMSWLTVSPKSGSGNGTITLTAPPNTSTGPRSTDLTITTVSGDLPMYQFLGVTQDKASSSTVVPTLSLSQLSWTSLATADSRSVTVSSNTSWSVSSDSSWLTVSPTSGSGTGVVTVSVAANVSSTTRSGSVKVWTTSGSPQASQTLQVTQPGAPATTVTPQITLSTSSMHFTAAGGSQSVVQWTNVDVRVRTEVSWVTLGITPGFPTATVAVKVAANTSLTPRSTPVTFYSGVWPGVVSSAVQVTQDGAAPAPQLSLSTAVMSFVAPATSGTVVVTSNTAWTVSSDSSWLTVSPKSGTGNGPVMMSLSANTSTVKRSAVVTVTTQSSGGVPVVKTVQVSQDGVTPASVTPSLSVSASPVVVPGAGGQVQVPVSSNTSWTVAWSCLGSYWLTGVTPGSGNGNGSLTLTASRNTGTQARTAILIFTVGSGSSVVHQYVTVTQPVGS